MSKALNKSPVCSASLLALIVIIADQISKWWLITSVLSNDAQTGFFAWLIQKGEQLRFPHIPLTDFFNLVMVWNKGISFGLFQKDSTIMPVILSVLALGITVGFLFWVRESTSRWMTLGTGLIIGGALGNVWDRVRFGAVADFFDFYIGTYHWPAFNIADSAITIGVVLLLIHLLQEKPAANVQS